MVCETRQQHFHPAKIRDIDCAILLDTSKQLLYTLLYKEQCLINYQLMNSILKLGHVFPIMHLLVFDKKVKGGG